MRLNKISQHQMHVHVRSGCVSTVISQNAARILCVGRIQLSSCSCPLRKSSFASRLCQDRLSMSHPLPAEVLRLGWFQLFQQVLRVQSLLFSGCGLMEWYSTFSGCHHPPLALALASVSVAWVKLSCTKVTARHHRVEQAGRDEEATGFRWAHVVPVRPTPVRK
eukprot:3681151-Rhodomonas_salina.2